MPLIGENIWSTYAAFVIGAIVVCALIFGQDLLIPLALAGCLSFVLAPIVKWITLRRIPHGVAVAFVVMVFVAGLMSTSALFANQIVSLVADLGNYRENLKIKVRSMSQSAKSEGALKQASDSIGKIGDDIAREMNAPATVQTPERAGLPTVVVQSPTSPNANSNPKAPQEVVVSIDRDGSPAWLPYISAIKHPIAAAGLTLLLTLFILLQSADLRDRVVRLAGTNNLSGTTVAIEDAAERLSRLYLAMATVNVLFGVVVGLALWLIGLPNSALWGALAALMRFVPFIGGLIAAVPPFLLAAAVDPGWGMAVAVLAVFLIGEPIMGHLVEPMLLGPQAGLSPFAMLLSTGFWALVWGPIGLLLAAPLTMILVVLGRHLKGLEFITVLLGDEPALSAPQALYQRLLSEDDIGALDVIDVQDGKEELLQTFDTVMLPALQLASPDYDRGQLSRGKIAAIKATFGDLVETIDFDVIGENSPTANAPQRIAVIPVRNAFDRAAASFIAQAVAAIPGAVVEGAGDTTGIAALNHLAKQSANAPHKLILVSVGGRDAQFIPTVRKRALHLFPDSHFMIFAPNSPTIQSAKGADDSHDQITATLKQLIEQICIARASEQRAA